MVPAKITCVMKKFDIITRNTGKTEYEQTENCKRMVYTLACLQCFLLILIIIEFADSINAHGMMKIYK